MILYILGVAQLLMNAMVFCLCVWLYLHRKATKEYVDARVENLKMEKDAQIAALERIISARTNDPPRHTPMMSFDR